ncbi:MAG: glycosyltransferase family 1 protein [Verrucomicrobiota bacterium]
MKICLVTETFPPEVNGVAMTNRRLADGMADRGHRIFVIRPRQKGEHREISVHAGVSEYTVPGIPLLGYPGIQMGLPVYFQLKRMFEKFQPDVVHVATEGPLGIASLLAAKKLGLPVTSTFHTNFQLYCQDYGAKWLTQTMLSFLRWFHNACALTFVPSQDLIEELRSSNFERLFYLGRGVDRALFDPGRRNDALRKSWGAPSEDIPVAIYVGRAAAEKDIPLAIKAFEALRKRIPEARMVVVGDGPVREKVEAQFPDVHFAGMRYGEDLGEHYASADLFLFASTSETFGNVVTEAMTSGLVSVVYNYAAGQKFIRDGENGFLAKFDDAEDFVRKTEALADCRDRWAAMGIAARTTTEIIPWAGIIGEFEGHLRRVIDTQSSQALGGSELIGGDVVESNT